MNEQDRITQLEASCAAMRELLITIRQQVFPGLDLPAKYTVWMHEALSTDAGKKLLERLQAVETELAIANQSISEIQPALGKLKDQLQAVEKALTLCASATHIHEGDCATI